MYNKMKRDIFIQCKKRFVIMDTIKVEIDIPKEIEQFTVLRDKDAQLVRNAMLVYPYIQNGTISHGRAAEMLGIFKMDLITLYGKLGLPYLDESASDLEEDLLAIKEARSATLC